jgi:hypothetical protein
MDMGFRGMLLYSDGSTTRLVVISIALASWVAWSQSRVENALPEPLQVYVGAGIHTLRPEMLWSRLGALLAHRCKL